MMRIEVHRAGALPRAKLVRVRERVLQQLHDRDHAARLVLDVLDRGAELAKIAEQQRHAAAALRQLQGRVDAARDRLHAVFDAHEEAADRLAALRLAEVQERRRGRLERAGEHLVEVFDGPLLAAGRQFERDRRATLREVLQIQFAVERLQRV